MQVWSEAKRLDVTDKGAMVVAEVVFDKNILKQIKEYKMLFLRVSCSTSHWGGCHSIGTGFTCKHRYAGCSFGGYMAK